MDVVKIATERRESLRMDLRKIDEFIRTAEWLIDSSQRQSDNAGSTAAPSVRPAFPQRENAG